MRNTEKEHEKKKATKHKQLKGQMEGRTTPCQLWQTVWSEMSDAEF